MTTKRRRTRGTGMVARACGLYDDEGMEEEEEEAAGAASLE